MKVLGIVGLVWAGLCGLFLVVFDTPTDYEAAIGWGIYAVLYLIALSIVAIVKAKQSAKLGSPSKGLDKLSLDMLV